MNRSRRLLSACLAAAVAVVAAPARAAGAEPVLPGPVTAFGDSIVRGVGASVIGETNWAAVLGTRLATTVANRGIDSSQIFDHADAVFATEVDALSVSAWAGVNDQRLWPPGPASLDAFSSAHLAELVWLAVPDGAKVRGAGPEVDRRGEWTPNAYAYGGQLGAYATAPGSTATATVHGTAVYVATVQQQANTSVVRVSVDGVRHADVATATAVGPTRLGRSYGPALVRVGGLAPGPHVVELSVVAADPGNPAHLLWVAGSAVAADGPAPTVYSGDVVRQSPASYEAHGGSDANVAAYGAAIAANCARLRADGLRVVCVDLTSRVDPDGDLEADGAHPNDRGHLRIAEAFHAAMTWKPPPGEPPAGDAPPEGDVGEGDPGQSRDRADGDGADPATDPAADPSRRGYWLVASDGGVFSFGDAGFHGSTGALRLARPVVAMAPTPSGRGYWLVASDGGVFAFGDAGFHGSTGALRLARPVVAMAPTPSGRGYWLVASDGGVFAFGDARFHGSTGALGGKAPVVAVTSSPTGQGYRLVASDGGVFAFGDAGFSGSAGGLRLARPVVAAAAIARGSGYWLVAADGGVFAFGDAADAGSAAALRLSSPIVGAAGLG